MPIRVPRRIVGVGEYGEKIFLMFSLSSCSLRWNKRYRKLRRALIFALSVNLVQLNVAVTDKSGNYITGLHPKDFAIAEDGITEKIATFAEGNEPAISLSELARPGTRPADVPADSSKDSPSGASAQTLDSLVSRSQRIRSV